VAGFRGWRVMQERVTLTAQCTKKTIQPRIFREKGKKKELILRVLHTTLVG
jgi:hypothetical protein